MRWRCSVVALGLAVGLFACNGAQEGAGESDDSPASQSAALEAGEGAAQVEAPLEDDPSEKMLPSETRRDIDWDAAEGFPDMPSEIVPGELASFYESAPVPVLLPRDAEALRTVEPTVGKNWYAAMFQIDGREVTIEGDRVIRQVDDLRPAGESTRTDHGFVITQTEGVLTLSFTAFRAAYTIDIECDEVGPRGTCLNEDFAVELANRLARLGGRQ